MCVIVPVYIVRRTGKLVVDKSLLVQHWIFSCQNAFYNNSITHLERFVNTLNRKTDIFLVF